MLNVFVEHYYRGGHAQNGWKPHVYSAVVNNVRAECNVDITKENVKSGCKTIDKNYVNASKVLSTSGLGWDWVHNKLLVDSEDVWINYVKLGNFTSAYKVDMAEVASHKKPSSREVILDALNALVGPANDGLLVAYDILIADDHKFMAVMALPKRMKRNLYTLTIVFKDSLHE
ncbi:hypothetical protein D1007_42113 [Hordeum vulgare]|nr:hypothetical protein D1007_42113 [Hordeum vulgare]